MLLPSPQAVDVQEIQFKLHAKQNIFNESDLLINNASLLSVSSTQGLLFAGNPNAPELKVFMLHNLVEAQVLSKPPLVRSINLPSPAICLACSADGKMLAINYNHNGNGILQIYSVSSFTTSHIKSLYTVLLSPEEHVCAFQLIWNPVLTNILAVILSNGALLLYTLKEAGQFEMHSLDKSQQVQCGCWSPKGKQIVLGFHNGKLQQFKPDLTPAKSIVCPANVLATPFDTLAVHWLSTYQFATIYLQQNEEAHPALYIVNAPKGGTPSYVCYDDVCYSTPGPRSHHFSFTHVAQWNILLVCSANGVEVGIIATKESGDTPKWVQYLLLDEARIELPLTESKDESFPLGFCFDTAATHQLVVGEQTLPIMPMVHVLSTHGHLVSFNFLNLTPNAADVCSPPLPVTDESGEFHELDLGKRKLVTSNNNQSNAPVNAAADTNFNFATSTPAQKEKTTSFFSGAAVPTETYFPQPAAAATVAFGTKTAEPVAKTTTASATSFGTAPAQDLSGFALSKSNSAVSVPAVNNEKTKELNKPLYTVPPTFVPPATTENAQAVKAEKPQTTQTQMNDDEITEVVRQMINVQIEAFDTEMQHISKAFTTNIIGNLDEVKQYTRRLNDLQEIIEQANDREFEMDVQNLRHALSESYAMLAEVRSKMEQYNNTDITPLAGMTNFEAMDRRQVAKLQSYLAANEAQLQQVQLQIDTQWSNFQDLIRRNTKTKMHIPCLDGIYQRMTKLKDLVARQRIRLNCIHSKLKQQGFYYNSNGLDSSAAFVAKTDAAVLDSLTDSILSLSISQAVQENRAKLSPQKLNSIRQILRQRESIVVIKPRRPDRVDLNSEVILETKLRNQQQTQRELRAGATASLDKMLQQQTPTPTPSPAQPQQTAAFNFSANKESALPMGLTKPTATKATPSSTNVNKPVSFGASSSFVKPTAVTSMSKLEQVEKPAFGAFNANFNFALPKGTTVVPVTAAESAPAVMPISFAAKVIGGDASKTNGTKTFKPDISHTGFAALLPNTATPFTMTSNTASNNNNNSSSSVTERKVEEVKPAVSSCAPALPFSGFMSKAATNVAPSFNFTGLSGNGPPSSTANTTKPVFSGFSAAPLNTNNNNRKAEAPTVVSAFSGFGKAIGELGTLSSTNTTTTTTKTTTMAAADNKPSFAAKTTTTAAATVSNVVATSSAVTTTTKTTEAADNLFSNLNICKPTVKEDTDKSTTNVFGSSTFSFGNAFSDASKLQFGATAITTTSAAAPSSEATTPAAFSFTNTLGNMAKNISASTAASTQSVLPTTNTTVTTTTTIASNTTAVAATSTANSSTPFSGFGDLSSSLPQATTTAATATTTSSVFAAVATPTTAVTTQSIFGGTTSFLGSSSTPSAFGGAAVDLSTPSTNVFGVPSSTTVTTTAGPVMGMFGNAAATTTTASDTGLFSSVPKPAFGQSPPSGFFAAAAQATSPVPFGNNTPTTNSPANTGGSIFGGNVGGGFGTPSSNNVFGGTGTAAAANASPFGGNTSASSIFSGGPAKPAEGGNLFAAAAGNNSSSGSIFGQSSFGQTAATGFGNAFGAKPNAASPGFGSPNSIFGGGAQNTGVSGGSMFGGFGGATTGGFGSSPSSPGSFAQGGASVAQTGFGSPQSAGGFTKPVFGAAATFGSPPAFGTQPSFGGAPLFGSPKAFGTFAAPAANSQQTSPFAAANKDNIFETLGSSESGLSFGNLAQNTNTAPKPAFGGSSFMNYRA